MQASSSGGFFRPQVLNRILLVLGFIGIFDASLLSAEVLYGLNLSCGVDSGCAAVASDPSAKWFGFPVAYFGLGAYLTFTILAAIRAVKGFESTKTLTYIGYGMAAFGAVTSIVLQKIALLNIHAFCPYCFGSAVNMILTLIVYAVLSSKLSESGSAATDRVRVNDSAWVGVGSIATFVAVIAGAAILQSHRPVTPVVTDNAELKLLNPDPTDVHSYGDSKSPIKVIEFADLACIHCQEMTPKLHDFVDKYPGRIWTIYRHYPLEKVHHMAVTAALVSEYAARKGKFWDYADRIFALNAEPLTWDDVSAPAAAIGLNLDDIKTEIQKENSPEMAIVQKDMAVASHFGLNTTPTFFIEAPGLKVHVATSADIFEVLSSSPYKEILNKK